MEEVEQNHNENNMEGLFSYLKRTADGQHKEFRLVVRVDGSSYIHVMNENSETFDFSIKE